MQNTTDPVLRARLEEERVKSRARMVRYRSRLKELPEEEQAAPRERARASRARYRHKIRRAHAPQDSLQCQPREAKLVQDSSQTNFQSESTRRPPEADLDRERDDTDFAQQNTRCSSSFPPSPHAHVMRHNPSPPHAYDMPRDYGGYICPTPPYERHATSTPPPPPASYTPQRPHGGDIPYPNPHSASPLTQVLRPDHASAKVNNSVRRRCFNCCTTETSMWLRSNLVAGEVLCNRCGLYEYTHAGPRPTQFTHEHGSLGDPADRSRSLACNAQPVFNRPPEYPPRSASAPPPGAFRVLSSHWRTQTT
ncbi:hypothetical protein C8R47DRAFT_406464 [Mycena vitilis]|nr:hypothetical protein C8R47DRAFT_406464 [Mycena vitilis]